MKRIFKKATALTTICALTLGTFTNVYAAQVITDKSGNTEFTVEAGGVGTLDNVILNVQIPTNMVYTIDPYGVSSGVDLDGKFGVTDSQISSPNYRAINKSNVAVAVDFKAVVNSTPVPAVTITNANDVYPDLAYKTTKDAYIAILAADDSDRYDSAKSNSSLGFDYANFTTPTKLKYTPANNVSLSPVSPATGTGSATFLLGAATDAGYDFVAQSGWGAWTADTLATGSKGGSYFRLYGKLNTFANWAATDLDIDGVFTIKPYSSTSYTKVTDSNQPAYAMAGPKALNQLRKVTPPVLSLASGSSAVIEDVAATSVTVNISDRTFKTTGLAIGDFFVGGAQKLKVTALESSTDTTATFTLAGLALNDKFIIAAKKAAFDSSPDPEIDASTTPSNAISFNVMKTGFLSTATTLNVAKDQDNGMTLAYIFGDKDINSFDLTGPGGTATLTLTTDYLVDKSANKILLTAAGMVKLYALAPITLPATDLTEYAGTAPITASITLSNSTIHTLQFTVQ